MLVYIALALVTHSVLSKEVLSADSVDQSILTSGDEVSIAALRAKEFAATLVFEKPVYVEVGIKGDLYSYTSDGLKIYALVITPNGVVPDDGFPVLIYGHGFHPEPKKYGVTSTGVVSRPGDYYRGIPERYALEGYLVIAPDYRGHNISEGFEFTERNSLSSSYYASDVLHLISAIGAMSQTNSKKTVYAGHSMGGDVGLKALLATKKIRAASLWSPAVGSTSQRALYYGHFYDDDKNAAVNKQKFSDYRKKIDGIYADLQVDVLPRDVDAINHLEHLSTPLIIHHARGDRSVPYQWSENLVLEMNEHGKEYLFYSYDTRSHLFEGENLESAFQRDLKFFNAH